MKSYLSKTKNTTDPNIGDDPAKKNSSYIDTKYVGDETVTYQIIFGNEKIVFIYNKYEIAPYAFGDIMINVTYDELKDLLK